MSQREPSVIESAFRKIFTRPCEVGHAETLGRFRLLTLQGQALRGVAWRPGEKVELFVAPWVKRTYTPLAWDSREGTLQLLAYLHDRGPGSQWARSVAVGEPCTVFGPRRSLELDVIARPGLLFGDETSIGLALSLEASAVGAVDVRVLLESDARDETEALVARMGVANVHVVQRTPNDAHLLELEPWLRNATRDRGLSGCVLSGKASSIQVVNRQLRALGFSSRDLRTRAYWAEGKAGLD